MLPMEGGGGGEGMVPVLYFIVFCYLLSIIDPIAILPIGRISNSAGNNHFSPFPSTNFSATARGLILRLSCNITSILQFAILLKIFNQISA